MRAGDMNLWPLARLFKWLPFPTNYDRRQAYLRTRDRLLKALSWLSGMWGCAFSEA